MYDDKTAVTIDNGVPERKSSPFSFFGTQAVNKRIDAGLKYTGNMIDEAMVEDDPVMGKERAKYGHTPKMKTAQKRNTKKAIIISFIIFALLVVIVFGGTRYMASPARQDRLLSLGDKYLAELDFENAILAYEAALKINAENKLAYIGLVKSYLGLKKYENALKTADAAISIFGRTEELVELRRRVFTGRIGKEGLYLDTGTFVAPNDRLRLEDLEDAFLYYGQNTIYLGGTVKDSQNDPVVNASALTKLPIKPDTIYPLAGNTFTSDLVLSHIEGKGQDNCWLVLETYSTENGDDAREYRYQVVSPDYKVTANNPESAEEEATDITVTNDIEETTEEEESNADNAVDGEEAVTEQDQSSNEPGQSSNDMGLYLADGTKVSNLGTISLSDLKNAQFNVGKNDAYFAAEIYMQPYYLDEDPYEQNWAYSGPYKPGSSISMSDYANSFNSYPDYNYLWVTIKDYNEYQNGDYSTGQEFNYKIAR